jgi:hypothetical protein
MSGVALHAVKPAAVNRHDRALHVDQVVLAQIASNPFPDNSTQRRRKSANLAVE